MTEEVIKRAAARLDLRGPSDSLGASAGAVFPKSTRLTRLGCRFVDSGTTPRLRLPQVGFHAASATLLDPRATLDFSKQEMIHVRMQRVKIQCPKGVNFQFLLTAGYGLPNLDQVIKGFFVSCTG